MGTHELEGKPDGGEGRENLLEWYPWWGGGFGADTPVGGRSLILGGVTGLSIIRGGKSKCVSRQRGDSVCWATASWTALGFSFKQNSFLQSCFSPTTRPQLRLILSHRINRSLTRVTFWVAMSLAKLSTGHREVPGNGAPLMHYFLWFFLAFHIRSREEVFRSPLGMPCLCIVPSV